MNKRLSLTACLALLLSVLLSAQTIPERPKLIVGIVVDQMRYDYLYRYQSKYGPGGFKRLLREGFSCENAQFNYAPTYTGPGHAAIYSGATPAVSGIIGNDWYDRSWGRNRYVTADTTVLPVGTDSLRAGRHSPRVLLSTTITDELRLSNNFQSKVVGVCLKDRGSILPAGHIPNAAYWFDDATGNWITSSYYPDSLGLPQWVQDFNARHLPDTYLSQPWNKLRAEHYTESFGEAWLKYNKGKYLAFPGNLPYNLPAIKQKTGYTLLRFTPGGNVFTVDFALEAIEKMELGRDEYPDVLCLSFSSPDYCGHQFGVHAEETQDMYLRLDAQIARLLRALDEQFGKNNVLVFLTADHGGAETPVHLQDLQIPAGVFPESTIAGPLNQALVEQFGRSGRFVLDVTNQQVWLDHDALAAAGIRSGDACETLKKFLRKQPGVYDAYTPADLFALPADYPFAPEIRRGLHPRRSGDVVFHLDPAWHADDKSFSQGGTTHGSPYPYDAHVPLIWYGWKVPTGETFAPASITDIAPTLAAMLRIMRPNGSTGSVIQQLMR
ncbi:MAG: alkaline phosphatase family protein [Lewinellaceae bacterium]|nr:alkaline phosphatase family protein [Lewinellaceae bacterium]